MHPDDQFGEEHELKLDTEGIGLCIDCSHMRRIRSAKGSTFYLCQRSATDPNFPKYPRLPVLKCSGYEPTGTADSESSRE